MITRACLHFFELLGHLLELSLIFLKLLLTLRLDCLDLLFLLKSCTSCGSLSTGLGCLKFMLQVADLLIELFLLLDSDLGHASELITHSCQLGREIGRDSLFLFLKCDDLNVFRLQVRLIVGDHLAQLLDAGILDRACVRQI